MRGLFAWLLCMSSASSPLLRTDPKRSAGLPEPTCAKPPSLPLLYHRGHFRSA